MKIVGGVLFSLMFLYISTIFRENMVPYFVKISHFQSYGVDTTCDGQTHRHRLLARQMDRQTTMGKTIFLLTCYITKGKMYKPLITIFD